MLVAVGKRRLDVLDFHRAIPFGCRGNRSAVSAKTDEIRLVTKLPAAKLPEIVLTTGSHLGRFGVPDMRVMRPPAR
jgi:hypothetical protein